MSEEYLDIEEGMPVAAVILSTSRRFKQLAGLTDFCIPDAQCWVGDYPYLDRSEFESSIVRDGLWDTLLDEGEDDFANFDDGDDRDDVVRYEEYDEEYEYKNDEEFLDDDDEIDEDESFDDESMQEAMERNTGIR